MNKNSREDLCDVLITDKLLAKDLKNKLEDEGLLNKKYRIKEFTETKVAVPIVIEKFVGNDAFDDLQNVLHETQLLMPFSKTHLLKLKTLHKDIEDKVIDLFYSKTKKSLSNEHLQDLPTEWQVHGDMLLLPKDCMNKEIWKYIMPEIWHIYCAVLKVTRIAKRQRIADDEFRSSKVKMIFGDNGWIMRKENGITYHHDITKCMFSDGNITEKLRIAKFDCKEMTVVDLYAGIGYFVLPYLVHAGAKMVYACEWNPDAIEALKKNLYANNVSDKCVVLEGDNRLVAPKCVADHVNLGLIPSSEESWPTACKALNPTKGGWLHIHANINAKEISLRMDQDSGRPKEVKLLKWNQWALDKVAVIKMMLMECHDAGEWLCHVDHIEHVKSYAPHIDHVVVDLECRPERSKMKG